MKRKGFTLVELMVVVLIISLLMALLLPALSASIRSARNLQSNNNLRQIGTAVHEFHDAMGHFPVASDDSSIFVQLLPYLERQALADQIEGTLNDPTKNLADAALVATPSGGTVGTMQIPTFIHPGYNKESKTYTVAADLLGDGTTTAPVTYSMLTYKGVRGSTASLMAEQGLFGIDKKRRIDQIGDGLTNTLAVGEHIFNYMSVVEPGTYCNDITGSIRGWMKGLGADGHWDVAQMTNDATSYLPPGSKLDTTGITSIDALPFCNPWKKGAVFAMADGSTQFISSEIDATVLEALTICNDQALNEFKLD